jgi:hypothetical protein
MTSNGYSKTALVGNWYEERLANQQKFREEPDFRKKREEEDAISFMTNTNLLMPLGTVKRAHEWDTKACIVDDGFREYKTMNKTNYDPLLLNNYKQLSDCRSLTKSVGTRKNFPESNPSQIQTSGSRTIAMLNQNNLQRQINETNRDVTQKMSDFGSTFRKHEGDHQRFHNMTTNSQFFDREKHVTPEEYIKTQGAKLKSFAGYEPRTMENQGIKMNSTLTGEIYKSEKDPQQNTRIQRSWLPYTENAIIVSEQNIQKNQTMNATAGLNTTNKMAGYRANNNQTNPHDIATSLPLGDGVHTLNSKWMEPNAYRRIRTDVTLIRNQPITRK